MEECPGQAITEAGTNVVAYKSDAEPCLTQDPKDPVEENQGLSNKLQSLELCM